MRPDGDHGPPGLERVGDTAPVAEATALGRFLSARRAATRPQDVGLPPPRPGRRAPGLRREEVAALAHVSPAYYRRLEQGQSRNPSSPVLDALATALRASPDERAHLHHLALTARRRALQVAPGPETASAAARTVLDGLELPAMVTGRLGDVLAWNRAGHALVAPHLGASAPDDPRARPNTLRLVLADAWARRLFTDWAGKARGAVAHLRHLHGLHPGDPQLEVLTAELLRTSAAVADLWASAVVARCTSSVHEVLHPAAGRLQVVQQTLAVLGSADQSLVVLAGPTRTHTDALSALART